MNIYQRINAVRKKVPFIVKDKEVRGGGSYKAVTHDAVTAAIRDALIEHEIVIVPKLANSKTVETPMATVNGTPYIRVEATYDIHFVNADTPDEFVVVPVLAHALDHGDKAPGKCLSYATKSAVLKLFSIETGESDEERPDAKAASQPGAKLLKHNKALRELLPSVLCIKENLGEGGDTDTAAEAVAELTAEEFGALWVATEKGGIWTVEERKRMKSDPEFTKLVHEKRKDRGWYENPENKL